MQAQASGLSNIGRFQKWTVPKSPLELEPEEKGMFPTKSWKNEKLKKFYKQVWKSIDNPGIRTGFWEGFFNRNAENSNNPNITDQQNKLALKTAVAFKCMQLTDGEIDGQIDEKFVEEFINWMLGKSKYNLDKETTPWGARRLVGKDINAYLHLFVDKKVQFIKELTVLKAFIPQNLPQAWNYFKYICCRKEPNHAYFLPAMNYWTDPSFKQGGSNYGMRDPITGIPYGQRAPLRGPGVPDGVIRDSPAGGGDPGGRAIVTFADDDVFDPGECDMPGVVRAMGGSGLPPQAPPPSQLTITAPDASLASGDQPPNTPIATPTQGETSLPSRRDFDAEMREYRERTDAQLEEREENIRRRHSQELTDLESRQQTEREKFEKELSLREEHLRDMRLKDVERAEEIQRLQKERSTKERKLSMQLESLKRVHQRTLDEYQSLIVDKDQLEIRIKELNKNISNTHAVDDESSREKEALKAERDALQGRIIQLETEKNDFQKTVEMHTRDQINAVHAREKEELIQQHENAFKAFTEQLSNQAKEYRLETLKEFTQERMKWIDSLNHFEQESAIIKRAYEELSNQNEEMKSKFSWELMTLRQMNEQLKNTRGIQLSDISERDEFIKALQLEIITLREQLQKQIGGEASNLSILKQLEEMYKAQQTEIQKINDKAKQLHEKFGMNKFLTLPNVMSVIDTLARFASISQQQQTIPAPTIPSNPEPPPPPNPEPPPNPPSEEESFELPQEVYNSYLEEQSAAGQQIVNSLIQNLEETTPNPTKELYPEEENAEELPDIEQKDDTGKFYRNDTVKRFVNAAVTFSGSLASALYRTSRGDPAYAGDNGFVLSQALQVLDKTEINSMSNYFAHVYHLAGDSTMDIVPFHIPDTDTLTMNNYEIFFRRMVQIGKMTQDDMDMQMKNLQRMQDYERATQNEVNKIYNKPEKKRGTKQPRGELRGSKRLKRTSGAPIGVSPEEDIIEIYETPEAQEPLITEQEAEGEFTATSLIEIGTNRDPWREVTRENNPEEVFEKFFKYYKEKGWTDVKITREFLRRFRNFSYATKESGNRNKVWIEYKTQIGRKANEIIKTDRAREKSNRKSGALSHEEIQEKVNSYNIYIPDMIPIPIPPEISSPSDYYMKILQKLTLDYHLSVLQADKYFLERTKDLTSEKWMKKRKEVEQSIYHQLYKSFEKRR